VARATAIHVVLADGRELAARVLGLDPRTDLALLKIEASGFHVVPLADSAQAQVGEPVMAIGNPFGARRPGPHVRIDVTIPETFCGVLPWARCP
jgi:S1-C subfamily serine protease